MWRWRRIYCPLGGTGRGSVLRSGWGPVLRLVSASVWMSVWGFVMVGGALGRFSGTAQAQQPADPLSEVQADQVRELGDRPNERIKLYLKFVEERVTAIRDLSVDSHENSRPADLRSKLEEFTRLSDELADNIDSYTAARADVRKALKTVLETSAKWPEALRKAPADPVYEFARRTALDAAVSSNEDAKKLLADQEAYFAAHKEEAGKNGKAASMPQKE